MSKKKTRCCEQAKSGKPCAAAARSTPDPDGQHRCVPHSKHPDAIATRKKQAAAGTAVAKKRAAERREERGLPPAPPPAPVAPGALDLSTPDGVRAALQDTWARMLAGSVNPEVAKAAASLGRTALALVAAKGGGGKSHGDKIIVPTIVQSMDDVRRLKEANSDGLEEIEAAIVH